jgi:hypothetical protein
MMLGVAGFQATQHQAGGVVVRLIDFHHLEAALQGGVALEVLFVFDQVVAAMVRSSPRASAGFSRLAASAPPAWLPAPMMVCASSINSRTGAGTAAPHR